MSGFWGNVFSIVGVGYIMYARNILLCLFPVLIKIALMYLTDCKGYWRVSVASVITQGLAVSVGALAARIIDDGELGILDCLKDVSLTGSGLSYLILFVVICFAVDYSMIAWASKTLTLPKKAIILLVGTNIVNFGVMTFMFMHQIIISI